MAETEQHQQISFADTIAKAVAESEQRQKQAMDAAEKRQKQAIAKAVADLEERQIYLAETIAKAVADSEQRQKQAMADSEQRQKKAIDEAMSKAVQPSTSQLEKLKAAIEFDRETKRLEKERRNSDEEWKKKRRSEYPQLD